MSKSNSSRVNNIGHIRALIVQNIVIQVGVQVSNDHRFAIGAYTSYFQVGEFLMNSDRRLSYSPKLVSQFLSESKSCIRVNLKEK